MKRPVHLILQGFLCDRLPKDVNAKILHNYLMSPLASSPMSFLFDTQIVQTGRTTNSLSHLKSNITVTLN